MLATLAAPVYGQPVPSGVVGEIEIGVLRAGEPRSVLLPIRAVSANASAGPRGRRHRGRAATATATIAVSGTSTTGRWTKSGCAPNPVGSTGGG